MSAENKKPRILIVDDEPEIRDILREIMSELDVDFTEAQDGQQAWEYLQKNRVDLVITDIRMPRMSGNQLCQKIVEERIPTAVIVVTGFGDIDQLRSAIKYGVFDLIDKPFEKEVVLGRVQNALEGQFVRRAIVEMIQVLSKGLELEEKRDFERMTMSERLDFLRTVTQLARLRMNRMDEQARK